MVGGAKQAELDYNGGIDVQCTKLCSLSRGENLKIRYFEIESGGTFCKMHSVAFISHDRVIVPTTLNIKQVKSGGGGGGGKKKKRGGVSPPPLIYPLGPK